MAQHAFFLEDRFKRSYPGRPPWERFSSQICVLLFGRRKIYIFTMKYAIFVKFVIFTNQEAETYYRTRLEFNIMFFLARPGRRHEQFYTTKIDFSDSDKKSRVDLGLVPPEIVRNPKI